MTCRWEKRGEDDKQMRTPEKWKIKAESKLDVGFKQKENLKHIELKNKTEEI